MIRRTVSNVRILYRILLIENRNVIFDLKTIKTIATTKTTCILRFFEIRNLGN